MRYLLGLILLPWIIIGIIVHFAHYGIMIGMAIGIDFGKWIYSQEDK